MTFGSVLIGNNPTNFLEDCLLLMSWWWLFLHATSDFLHFPGLSFNWTSSSSFCGAATLKKTDFLLLAGFIGLILRVRVRLGMTWRFSICWRTALKSLLRGGPSFKFKADNSLFNFNSANTSSSSRKFLGFCLIFSISSSCFTACAISEYGTLRLIGEISLNKSFLMELVIFFLTRFSVGVDDLTILTSAACNRVVLESFFFCLMISLKWL